MRFSIPCAFALMFVLATPALHAQDKNAFEPMDVFRLEFASDPQISPDGKRVVYVRNFMDIKKDRRHVNHGHRDLSLNAPTEGIGNCHDNVGGFTVRCFIHEGVTGAELENTRSEVQRAIDVILSPCDGHGMRARSRVYKLPCNVSADPSDVVGGAVKVKPEGVTLATVT